LDVILYFIGLLRSYVCRLRTEDTLLVKWGKGWFGVVKYFQYCEIISICRKFNFMYFDGTSIHKFNVVQVVMLYTHEGGAYLLQWGKLQKLSVEQFVYWLMRHVQRCLQCACTSKSQYFHTLHVARSLIH